MEAFYGTSGLWMGLWDFSFWGRRDFRVVFGFKAFFFSREGDEELSRF